MLALKTRLLAAAMLVAMPLAAQAGPSDDLITNGDFSIGPTVTGGGTPSGTDITGSTELGTFSFNGSSYTSALNGWQVNDANAYALWYVASTAATQTAFSRYDKTSANAPYYKGSEYFRSIPGADGASSGFVALDGDPSVQAGIYQMLTGLTVGTVYELSFDHASAQLLTGNGSYNSRLYYNLGTSSTINTATSQYVQASANGSTTIPQGGTSPWTTQTAFFEATSTTEFLSFLSMGGSGQPPMALLDQISLYDAPEPSSVALLAGFVGLCAIARRRRAALSAAASEV